MPCSAIDHSAGWPVETVVNTGPAADRAKVSTTAKVDFTNPGARVIEQDAAIASQKAGGSMPQLRRAGGTRQQSPDMRPKGWYEAERMHAEMPLDQGGPPATKGIMSASSRATKHLS